MVLRRLVEVAIFARYLVRRLRWQGAVAAAEADQRPTPSRAEVEASTEARARMSSGPQL